MEFQEFVREKERMCKEITCLKCPLNELDAGTKCSYACFNSPEEAEKIVSDWVKEHPIVTNREKFIEIMRDNFLAADITIGTRFGKDYIEFPDGWMCEEYKDPGGKS